MWALLLARALHALAGFSLARARALPAPRRGGGTSGKRSLQAVALRILLVSVTASALAVLVEEVDAGSREGGGNRAVVETIAKSSIQSAVKLEAPAQSQSVSGNPGIQVVECLGLVFAGLGYISFMIHVVRFTRNNWPRPRVSSPSDVGKTRSVLSSLFNTCICRDSQTKAWRHIYSNPLRTRLGLRRPPS